MNQNLSAEPILSSRRSWYSASFADFLLATDYEILGRIQQNCDFEVLPTQSAAWKEQLNIIREAVAGLQGEVHFEFTVPRMGTRIDVVLIVKAVVLVLEFKTGAGEVDRAAEDQVWDYALDLKYFHEASHAIAIVPILIAAGINRKPLLLYADADLLYRPIRVHPTHLKTALRQILVEVRGDNIDPANWVAAPYSPTPTIVEAARALYSQHSVEALARHDAGAKNLTLTSTRLETILENARIKQKKVICFVTGVPGAGKTLVGLNVATRRRDHNTPTHAVFLSGNGPLVAVLQEALARDEVSQRQRAGEKVRKGDVVKQVKSFIQIVHHFRDEALQDARPPIEHVAIFDEAQRAWNKRQTANFMARKKKRPGFDMSEPEFLIEYLDRHLDWAMIICLVGGGQEINTGEAGIEEWLRVLMRRFSDWELHISDRLYDSEYSADGVLEDVRLRQRVHYEEHLHLAVSMRSFRAEQVSTFIKSLLDCELDAARDAYKSFSHRYPIVISRSLDAAKDWIRSQARGTERYGLVSSSRAQRLKPHAIDVRVNVNPVHYFLNAKDDTRSSYYLEDAATEFQVQGLELDWACVTWDGDLRFREHGWSFHDFRGSRWCKVKSPERQRYLLNTYRVLLTRARQGMAIFIPHGSSTDPTRSPIYYDATFDMLRELDIPVLS